jgi:hypothetical protein
VPVEVDEYFIPLQRYIHQNPPKAGLVNKLEKYPFSSYREYLFGGELTDTAFALELVGRDERMRLHQVHTDDVFDISGQVSINDGEIRRRIMHYTNGVEPHEIGSWAKAKREAKSEEEFDSLVKPGKLTVLPNCIFRRAKPVVLGVEVLSGRVKPKVSLMRAEDSSDLGEVDQVQDQGKAIGEAKVGMQVVISMDKPIAGRHVFERDVLYVKVPEADAKKLLINHMDDLTSEEQELLREFIAFMRKKTLFWAGV